VDSEEDLHAVALIDLSEEENMSQANRISRRGFLRLAATTGAVVMVAACVPVTAPTAPGEGQAATGEAVTLEFWCSLSGDAWQQLIDAFNEAHPDIEAVYTFTPSVTTPGTNPKFLAATLGGNPPDVFLHDGSSYAASMYLNAFEQIDALAEADGITSDLYWDAFWPKVVWRDHLYGLPFDTDARALYWNKALFAEAGLSEPPKTVAELDAMAEQLTKGTREAGYEQLGFIPWADNFRVTGWGWSRGANYWDEGTEQIHMNGPEIVAGLEWEGAYAQKYGIEELTSFTQAIAGETTDPFVTGNVAMMVTGDWELGTIERYAPDMEYGVAPVPVPDGLEFMTWSGGFVNGIPRGAKQIEASWEFLKYMGGKDAQLMYALLTRHMCTHIEAQTEFLAQDPAHQVFSDLMPNTIIEPVIPEWALVEDCVPQEQDVIYGRKTAQQALDELDAKVQEAIDRRLAESL
jgi:multiple sugar transport system substrate-binding protein